MPLSREVSIWAIQDRSGWDRPGNKPFVVRWTVAARPKSKGFSRRKPADVFRGRLLAALEAGERFDTDTGLPVSWAPSSPMPTTGSGGPSFLTQAIEHVKAKWPGWKPKSRVSAIEGLVIAACTLTDEPMPKALRDSARSYLIEVAFNPPALAADVALRAAQVRARDWLVEHSLPVAGIGYAEAEATMAAMGRKLDGSGPVTAAVLNRRRSSLNNCLKRAVRSGTLAANPVPMLDRAGPKAPPVRRVEREALPSLRQALDFCERIRRHGRQGRRYAVFFLVILLAGLRPSEVALLHDVDLHLPDSGWGRIKVWGGTVVAGRRYTESDEAWADQDQKWRDPDAPPRSVPIPPRLVAELRAFLEEFGVGEGGRVFVNSRGNPLTPGNTGKAWRAVRDQMWPAARDAKGAIRERRFQANSFYELVPYDFRHLQASLLLAAPNMSDAEAARRLGHSVDMLRRVYAAWFEDDATEGNAAMDAAYGSALGG